MTALKMRFCVDCGHRASGPDIAESWVSEVATEPPDRKTTVCEICVGVTVDAVKVHKKWCPRNGSLHTWEEELE